MSEFTDEYRENQRSISENIAEIEANIEKIERIWWRYGLPSIILAYFAVGLATGFLLRGALP